MKLFGTSGIRRIADRTLLELALKAGLAAGKVYPTMVTGRDTRTSGDILKHAFISGALASGSRCLDAGIIPTPTLALAAGTYDAGIMFTASHNPPEYNGIKMVNPDGSAFSPNQETQIEELITDSSFPIAHWEDFIASGIHPHAVEDHLSHILERVRPGKKLKVVLDCGCGAGCVISPEMLKRLGCEVISLNGYPTGFFPRAVEPTEENLANLAAAVAELGADLGIAHDGDADRMMAVDDLGRFIPGDKLLVLFSREEKAKKVVTTLDASMIIEEEGYEVVRTPIGDTYVSEELKNGGEFGGEPSGSWVFPGNSLCPDGIYAAARIVSIARRGRLSEFVDSIPHYPILRGSVRGDEINMQAMSDSLIKLNPVTTSDADGLRLGFEDSWVLVRPSGTEPKVRLTVEARDEKKAGELYNAALSIVETTLRGGNGQ